MIPKTLTYDVDFPGDMAAGMHAYSDTVQVVIESGNPGGEDGEFEAYMRDVLAEWFDGAKVVIKNSS